MRAGSFLSEDSISLPVRNPTGIGRTAVSAPLRDWASAAPPKQRAASPAEPRTKKSLRRTPSLELFISRLPTYLQQSNKRRRRSRRRSQYSLNRGEGKRPEIGRASCRERE